MPTLAAAGLDSNLETPEHDPDTPQNDQTSATYLPQLHFDRDPTLKYCFQAQFAGAARLLRAVAVPHAVFSMQILHFSTQTMKYHLAHLKVITACSC